MNRSALPTIPIPVQVADFPDTVELFVDFPTRELHVLDGKPPVPGARSRRRGLRATGWAALGSVTTVIVLVVTHPLGVHLLELSTGGVQ